MPSFARFSFGSGEELCEGSGEELCEETSVIGGSDNVPATLKKMIDEKRKNSETYSYYMDNGVKYVTGAARCKKFVETGEEQLMDVALTTDEVLALITCENYEDKWIDEHNNKRQRGAPSAPREKDCIAASGVTRALIDSTSWSRKSERTETARVERKRRRPTKCKRRPLT